MKKISKILIVLCSIICVQHAFAVPPNQQLSEAATLGNIDYAKSALDNGADVNTKINDNFPVLMVAVAKNHNDVAKLLLERGANPDATDKYGQTTLIFASNWGKDDAINLLLEHNANINARADDGETALIRAVMSLCVECVQILIDKKADIDVKNNAGKTALNVAQDNLNNTEFNDNDKTKIKNIINLLQNRPNTNKTTIVNNNKANKTEESDIKSINVLYTELMKIIHDSNIDKSVWVNKEGGFNTARLASDTVAATLLGTVGGVVTGVVVKKNQVKKGFEGLHCTVGGQLMADWGDEFIIGAK